MGVLFEEMGGVVLAGTMPHGQISVVSDEKKRKPFSQARRPALINLLKSSRRGKERYKWGDWTGRSPNQLTRGIWRKIDIEIYPEQRTA